MNSMNSGILNGFGWHHSISPDKSSKEKDLQNNWSAKSKIYCFYFSSKAFLIVSLHFRLKTQPKEIDEIISLINNDAMICTYCFFITISRIPYLKFSSRYFV